MHKLRRTAACCAIAAQRQIGGGVRWTAWRPAPMGVPRTLRNDLLAALGATTRQNLLAAGGLHARAKSGGTLATQLARLISAFHMIGSKAADLSKKRAGRVRSRHSGCQQFPSRKITETARLAPPFFHPSPLLQPGFPP